MIPDASTPYPYASHKRASPFHVQQVHRYHKITTNGVIKAVGCVKGEMVEEGRELVDIEED